MTGQFADAEVDVRCTCSAVRRAARHLTSTYDRFIAGSGLRTTQYATLGRAGRPFTIQALAREIGADRSTLGRNLRPLERLGLVRIETSEHDRRGRALVLTAAGRAKMNETRALWQAAQSAFEAAYGLDQTRALHGTLDTLAAVDLARPS